MLSLFFFIGLVCEGQEAEWVHAHLIFYNNRTNKKFGARLRMHMLKHCDALSATLCWDFLKSYVGRRRDVEAVKAKTAVNLV